MRWTSYGMSVSVVLACVTACPNSGKPGEGTETDGGSTAGSSNPGTDGVSNTSNGTGTTPPTSGAATETDGAEETGPETGPSSATETVGETETAGQTDPDTDDIETSLAPETGGDEFPPECHLHELTADASYELEFLHWNPLGNFDGDALCVVEAVTVNGGLVTTSMTCDVEGAPEPASLRFRDAIEGPVDWEAGDEVRLRAFGRNEFEFIHTVELRAAADDAILAVVAHGGSEGNWMFPEAFVPLLYSVSQPCGEETDASVQIDIVDPGKAELHLMSKRRGTLAIDAEHEYAVDVGKAVIDPSPHYSVHQEVVLRRVRIGG